MQSLLAAKNKQADNYVLRTSFVARRMLFYHLLMSEPPSLTSLLTLDWHTGPSFPRMESVLLYFLPKYVVASPHSAQLSI